MELGFETRIALQRIAVPLALSIAGGWLLTRHGRNQAADSESRASAPWAILLGAFFVAAGPLVSDLWQRELLLEPTRWKEWTASEPWMWMVWIVPASILLLAIVRCLIPSVVSYASWIHPLSTTLFIVGLWFCLPQGKGWEDKMTDLVVWLVVGTLAAAWNQLAIDSIASRPGGRWAPLVLVVQFACIAALALQSYAMLGEWSLVGLGLAVGLSVVSLGISTPTTLPMDWPLSVAIIPVLWMGVACLGVSQFYVSTPPPAWLIGAVLLLPSAVGLVDATIKNQRVWIRMLVGAMLSVIILGMVIAMVMQNQPEW
jgi:hypothetical protein